MRRLPGLVLLLFFALSAEAIAARYALIIGNAEYSELEDLYNTHADAQAYHNAFTSLGFRSTTKLDLTAEDTENAIKSFMKQVEENDEVAFVYAGHGWSDQGINYLLPVDAPKNASKFKLKQYSIELSNGRDGVLDLIREVNVKLTVAIIDACRNNSFSQVFGGRSAGYSRGLARIEAPKGTFVIFSAGEGQIALDRLENDPPEQRLSVFTRTFVPLLSRSIYLENAISIAQEKTYEIAITNNGHVQEPAYYDATRGPTCLTDRCDQPSSDKLDFIAAVESGSADALETFIRDHPFSSLVKAARDQLEGIRKLENQNWMFARDECNRLAEAPVNQDLSKGLFESELQEHAKAAVRACQLAHEVRPYHMKTHFQLARSYYASGQISRAVQMLRYVADRGHSLAAGYLGVLYLQGQGVDKDDAEAAHWIQRAAEQGNVSAQSILGWMHAKGRGFQKNQAEALRWYRKSADRGNALAQNNLGWMYATGNGVTKNDAEAFSWFRKAALQGHVEAQYAIGKAYARGKGITANRALAINWFRKAAEQGHNSAKISLDRLVSLQQEPGSFDEVMKQAEAGDASAQYELARRFQSGSGVEKNIANAIAWFEKSARQGQFAKSATKLGIIYAYGRGVEPNLSLAAEWFQKAVDLGDRVANTYLANIKTRSNAGFDKPIQSVREQQDEAQKQFELAMRYQAGLGTEKDLSKAAVLFRSAAVLGLAKAQYSFGRALEIGSGVTMDKSEALLWYRKAAEQGNAAAHLRIAHMHEFGQGAAKDPAEALFWYRKAADIGMPDAQYILGLRYRDGVLVDKDNEQAFEWLKKAADQLHFNAALVLQQLQSISRVERSEIQANDQARELYDLAFKFQNGSGVRKDERVAFELFKVAADLGLAEAQYNVGLALEVGRGVAKDNSEALRWYRNAANQGLARAQYLLGLRYRDGRNIQKDHIEAAKWFSKAAESGHILARSEFEKISPSSALDQYNLAIKYHSGSAVEKDEKAAFFWFQKAALQGNAQAQFHLGNYFADGTGVDQDETAALSWYRKSAVNGNVYAQYKMGELFEYGLGVPQASTDAIYWYRKSASQSYSPAQVALGRIEATDGTFQQYPATDMVGGDGDFEYIVDVDLAACKEICLRDENCQAVTYNTSARACFPKSEITTLFDEVSATTFVRSQIGPVNRSTVQLTHKSKITGSLLWETRGKDYPWCVLSCDTDPVCQGFNFNWKISHCEKFRSVDYKTSNVGIISGTK